MHRPPRFFRLASAQTVLALAALGSTADGLARQDDRSAASSTQASQIEAPAERNGENASKAYLDVAGLPAPAPRSMQNPGEQISRGNGRGPASQITGDGQGGPAMAQLSKAELDATLAQLSPAERRVLLQAIEGTDICDNPPSITAIIALCQNRLETRSQEFATLAERQASAEERLLRGDLESQTVPSVIQVIDRLSRSGAKSDDFSNQAIASIALGGSAISAPPGQEEIMPDAQGLGEETQALINALINQLGGRAP